VKRPAQPFWFRASAYSVALMSFAVVVNVAEGDAWMSAISGLWIGVSVAVAVDAWYRP